ncbi:UDP-galactose transporter [Entomophthora muscae]|uniref:UDP-galactose transporter n=1 Tax=Entomophthora muscae TaxID=34485 RepID=A0ACC2SQA8_9FUNG|nr:UDP-galactose transporter [Entomophthora muscae]
MFKFAFCVAGIYVCFLTWGILQERVSTTPYGLRQEKFNSFIFLNAVQASIACLVAFTYMKLTGQSLGSPSRELLSKLGQAAITNALASPFGYASLKHIDYPTLTLGKSCKLVPVLFLNVLLYRRKFPLYKYITVFLVTIGVSLFMLLQPTKKNSPVMSSSVWGLFLVFMNLMMDGLTNSTQDQIFRKFKLTSQQMMFYMQLMSAAIMWLWLLNPRNHRAGQCTKFYWTQPRSLEGYSTIFNLWLLRTMFYFLHPGALWLIGSCDHHRHQETLYTPSFSVLVQSFS